MNFPRPGFILTCSVASLLTAAAANSVHGQAAMDVWTGATSTDWNNPTNWSFGAVPDATNTTAFPTSTYPDTVDAYVNTNTGNIATVSTVIPYTPRDIHVGTGAGTAGRLDVTAGSLSTGAASWSFVGTENGTGTLNIADTTTTSTTNATGYGLGSGSYNAGPSGGRLYIGGNQDANNGFGGTGTVNVNTTGTITLGSDLYVGTGGNTSVGTLNMDAGTLNRTAGWAFVGGDIGAGGAIGTINQRGGTINQAGDTYVGRGGGSVGTINLTGGSFNATNNGVDANGNPIVNGNLHFGFNNGVGTLNMSGASSVTSATFNIVVGDGGTSQGVANINGGTISTGAAFILANGGTSQGTATMNSGTMTVGGEMWIGGSSHADNVFNLNGGSVTVNSWVAIGRFGGTGTLNINGGTYTKTDSGNGFFSVGAGNDATNVATVNLNDGGTLVVPKVISEAGTSTFNFNGGTLQANGDGRAVATINNAPDATFMEQLTTANVRNRGAIFNTSGFNITVPQPLVHSTIVGDNAVDGGLVKQGTGLLTLTGASTYTGITTVNAGGLVINGSLGGGAMLGAVGVGSGATLSGTGTLTLGASTVTIGGILAPGATPTAGDLGTLTANTTGAFTLTNTAALQFDITGVGAQDLIAANGAKLTVGGTLALNLGAGFNYAQSYVLFSGLTSEAGAFSGITGVAPGETPVLTFANGNLVLSFTAVPEPSTWAMGMFGLGTAALWLRRRRVA